MSHRNKPRFAWVQFSVLPVGETFEPIGAMHGHTPVFVKATEGRGNARGKSDAIIYVPASAYVRVVTTKWRSAKQDVSRKNT